MNFSQHHSLRSSFGGCFCCWLLLLLVLLVVPSLGQPSLTPTPSLTPSLSVAPSNNNAFRLPSNPPYPYVNLGVLVNRTIRASVVVQPPFIISNGDGTFGGFLVDMLHNLTRSIGRELLISNLKFNYTIAPVVNGSSLLGVVDDLRTGRADVGVVPMGSTFEFADDVDFSSEWFQTSYSVLVRDFPAPVELWNFLRPFTPGLWFLFIGSAVAVGVFSWVFDRFSPYGSRGNDYVFDEETRDRYRFPNSILNTLMVFVSQDGDPSICWSSRILLLGYFFACLIIVQTYTANLTTEATARVAGIQINGVEDLAQDGVSFGVLRASTVESWLANSDNAILQSLAESMILYDTYTAAIDALCTGSIQAVVGSTTLLQYQATIAPCSAELIGDPFQEQGWALPLPMLSPLRAPLTTCLQWVQNFEMFYDATRNQYFPAEVYFPTVDDNKRQGIEGLAGVFVVLVIFIVVGVLILAIEHLVFRHRFDDNLFFFKWNEFFGYRYPHEPLEFVERANFEHPLPKLHPTHPIQNLHPNHLAPKSAVVELETRFPNGHVQALPLPAIVMNPLHSGSL